MLSEPTSIWGLVSNFGKKKDAWPAPVPAQISHGLRHSWNEFWKVLKAGHPWTTQKTKDLSTREQIIHPEVTWTPITRKGLQPGASMYTARMHCAPTQHTRGPWEEACQTPRSPLKTCFISRYTKPVYFFSQQHMLPAWLEVSKHIFQVLLLLLS